MVFIFAWINGWVNNGEAGDLRRHRAHYNATVTVFEIALSTLVDIRSTNELTFGGPALILVYRRNMQ